MQTTPVVSVLMPVYNGGLYLREAVDSILAQTYPNFEFIVVDDGSTDESLEILAGYQGKDTRFVIIGQDHLGVISALNNGLQKARGKYIARIDADDLALPGRLEQQVKAMEASRNTAILGSAYFVMNEHGVVGHVVRYPLTNTAIRWSMLFDNAFANSSIMLRAEFLREHGLAYDTSIVHAEDYDLWSRVMEFGQAANLSEPLMKYRTHVQQASARNLNAMLEKRDLISLRNIRRLGVSIANEDVRVLRAWNHHFPPQIRREEIKYCRLLLLILEAFSSLPGIDLINCQQIRGYFLFRILAASLPGQAKAVWQDGLSGYLRIRDVPSIFHAGIARVFQSIHRQQFTDL
jgi:glycosyltransferase involved in cell wall biosynthesis